MPIRVQVTGKGIVEFPDGTTEDVMRKALSTLKDDTGSELRDANSKPLKEPTTWWGGALKGANDYMTELGQGMFESAAHPKTAGDFAGLMLPTAMGMGTPSILGLKSVQPPGSEAIGNKVVRAGARGAADVLDLTPNILASKTEGKVISGLRKFGEPPPRFHELPLAEQEAHLPRTNAPERVSVPPARKEPVPFHEKPLYQQMDSLPGGEGGVDYASPNYPGPNPEVKTFPPNTGLGKETAPVQAPPRLAGKAPTLEEELQKALEEAHAPESPTVTTAAPPVETAGAGPFKQSWSKSKTQNLGGYSSGRPPSIEDAAYKEMLKRMGKEVLPDEAMAHPTGPGPMAEDVGGGGSKLASEEASPSLEGLDTPAPDFPIPLRRTLSVDELAAEMRRHYGSRDAGRMLFPNQSTSESAAAIKRLAPGPSRTPIVAEERIRAAMNKAKGDDDPILKLLVAGLSGKLLASSSLDQQE